MVPEKKKTKIQKHGNKFLYPLTVAFFVNLIRKVMYLLLADWKGRTGECLARGHCIRTERSEVIAPRLQTIPRKTIFCDIVSQMNSFGHISGNYLTSVPAHEYKLQSWLRFQKKKKEIKSNE